MDYFNTSYGYNRNSYLKKIEPFINKDIIKVIIGMRRVGKSVLLRQIIFHLHTVYQVPEQDILYIDKESLDFDFLQNAKDLHQYVEEKKARYVLIDEVQEIKDWEKAVASLHKKGLDIFITGSNAKMLSSDLATYLAGRYISIPIFALSFQEFIQFHNQSSDNLAMTFQKYLRFGGFPLVSKFVGDQQSCYDVIKDILETIVMKDIIKRHQIRRPHLLQSIINYGVDNIGTLFSANKVANYLKSQRISLNVETVHDYLQYFCSTFALYQVRRYDIRGKRHLESADKYYLGDIGLRHALMGYKNDDIARFLENIVYLELLRQGYQVSIGKLEDLEIDFIAEKQEIKLYIQVSYLLATQETVDREFRPLQAIKDAYPKLVLSMDDEFFGQSFDGIQRKNILNWLLENS